MLENHLEILNLAPKKLTLVIMYRAHINMFSLILTFLRGEHQASGNCIIKLDTQLCWKMCTSLCKTKLK